jgi:hypothetical protein
MEWLSEVFELAKRSLDLDEITAKDSVVQDPPRYVRISRKSEIQKRCNAWGLGLVAYKWV